MNDKPMTHFTPEILGSTKAGTGTYSLQTGMYLETKDMAYVALTVSWTAHTGTGNLLISNLPFKVRAFRPHCNSLATVYPTDFLWNSAATCVVGEFQPGSYSCLLLGAKSGGSNTPIMLCTSGRIQMSGWYLI